MYCLSEQESLNGIKQVTRNLIYIKNKVFTVRCSYHIPRSTERKNLEGVILPYVRVNFVRKKFEDKF